MSTVQSREAAIQTAKARPVDMKLEVIAPSSFTASSAGGSTPTSLVTTTA